jgi:hypothetical protein
METTLRDLFVTLDDDEIVVIGKKPMLAVDAETGALLNFHNSMAEKLAHLLMKSMVQNSELLKGVKHLIGELIYCVNAAEKELSVVDPEAKSKSKLN